MTWLEGTKSPFCLFNHHMATKCCRIHWLFVEHLKQLQQIHNCKYPVSQHVNVVS